MHETMHLGLYVIFGVIMLPVYVMVVGWIFGKPKDYRSVALAFSYVIALLLVVIVGLFVVGMLTSLFTPY